jgi:peptidoglycan/xylan/chitin deacetylase (PgdA/CDA1 family)
VAPSRRGKGHNEPVVKFVAGFFANLAFDDILNRVIEQPAGCRRFQVLVYHKVSHDPHPYYAPLSPEKFEEQIAFLRRHYRIFDLEELVQRSMRGEIPKMAVAITFDDGYADNYEYAFPILQKHRVPATIFLATAAIDNKHKLWHDRIFDAFRFAGNGQSGMAFHQVIRQAKLLTPDERWKLVARIEDTLQPQIPEGQGARMLSWDQVKEMSAAGIRFGSHSVTHNILTKLGRDQVRRELMDSRSEVEHRLGMPVALFAYPNGQPQDYSEEVKRQVQEAGYACAMTTVLGSNTAGSDRFELKRGQPWDLDINAFRLRFFWNRFFGKPISESDYYARMNAAPRDKR